MTNLENQLREAKSAPEMLTEEFRKQLNRDFFIRFYPNSKESKSELISVDRFAEEIQKPDVFMNIIKRLDSCLDDALEVKLRRGIKFTFRVH